MKGLMQDMMLAGSLALASYPHKGSGFVANLNVCPSQCQPSILSKLLAPYRYYVKKLWDNTEWKIIVAFLTVFVKKILIQSIQIMINPFRGDSWKLWEILIVEWAKIAETKKFASHQAVENLTHPFTMRTWIFNIRNNSSLIFENGFEPLWFAAAKFDSFRSWSLQRCDWIGRPGRLARG